MIIRNWYVSVSEEEYERVLAKNWRGDEEEHGLTLTEVQSKNEVHQN